MVEKYLERKKVLIDRLGEMMEDERWFMKNFEARKTAEEEIIRIDKMIKILS